MYRPTHFLLVSTCFYHYTTFNLPTFAAIGYSILFLRFWTQPFAIVLSLRFVTLSLYSLFQPLYLCCFTSFVLPKVVVIKHHRPCHMLEYTNSFIKKPNIVTQTISLPISTIKKTQIDRWLNIWFELIGIDCYQNQSTRLFVYYQFMKHLYYNIRNWILTNWYVLMNELSGKYLNIFNTIKSVGWTIKILIITYKIYVYNY